MPRRVLIIGAGVAGRTLAADASDRGLEVVGFLDDVVLGHYVLGTLDQAQAVIKLHEVDAVFFAIPSIASDRLRAFLSEWDAPGVELSLIPRTAGTLTRDTVALEDLTDVDVLQLVGRSPVKHDLAGARDLVVGRTALVTGAAGSIGSRLAELLLALGAARVLAVDWWESGLFRLADAVADDRLEVVIADIKNEQRLHAIFARSRPELVFHAAAYKHVPLMEAHPEEAVSNNLGGTLAVLRLCAEFEVGHAVYVSTDKAVNPANVMGATKRLGELAMGELARKSPRTKYTAVRFGNVIQSNGSVMETFRRQIAEGGPVTVTHPDVTRFFMTIDEASQLIVQSAVIGRSGDVCVLDMGEPVRILDLARSLVNAVAPQIEVSITALRPGEKLYEELSYDPELVANTSNSKVFVLRDETEITVPFEAIDDLVAAVEHGTDGPAVRERLRDLGFNVA